MFLGMGEPPHPLFTHEQSAGCEPGRDDTTAPTPDRRWTDRAAIGTRRTHDNLMVHQRNRPTEPLVGSACTKAIRDHGS